MIGWLSRWDIECGWVLYNIFSHLDWKVSKSVEQILQITELFESPTVDAGAGPDAHASGGCCFGILKFSECTVNQTQLDTRRQVVVLGRRHHGSPSLGAGLTPGSVC